MALANSNPGSKQKLASRIVFSEVTRRATVGKNLINLLTVGAKDVVYSTEKKAQSNHTAPVTLVSDLSKNHGDNVSVMLIHDLNGTPTMGDGTLEGNEESMSNSDFELKINQTRHGVKQGGKMAQQRVGPNLVQVGRRLLQNYWPALQTECMLYHAAGARGDYVASDSILELDTPTSEFRKHMINPVTAPTFDRKFYGGTAESIDGSARPGGGNYNALTAADRFNYDTLEKISVQLQEMPHPPQAIDLSTDDKQMVDDPFYLFLVTPRMWMTFQQDSTDFRALVANALTRKSNFNHPLFQGDAMMHDHILIRKYHRPVRFYEGSAVKVCVDNNEATEVDQIVQPGVTVDRGILLGGQGVALAMGRTVAGPNHFAMHQEKYDGKNKTRTFIEWMSGIAKTRFRDRFGRLNDYGICTVDCAVDLT